MSYLYKTMRHNTIDVTWEDDSFASGWVASYCSLTRDGDIAKLKLDTGYAGGWIQKDGLNINAATYKYLVVSVKGDDRFFIEVYDGSWKSVTSGHEVAPSDYDFKVYDLSGVTNGTITSIRLGVGDAQQKEAYYDFVSFHSYQPAFATDKIMSIVTRHNETDLDQFEIVGTDDVAGGLSDMGCHLRILLNGLGGGRKVFAGVIEEATPEDVNGRVLKVSGRCFGQKLLLRTKSKDFTNREVSLAVKDLVEDLTEISTFQVETPSPTVTITKDFKYEYIMDGLKDLANWVGSDWEVKLGMGHDLRFRSRTSDNVPSLPYQIREDSGHILRGVRKEIDAFRLFNKVTVIGGILLNLDGNRDVWTEATTGWTVTNGTISPESPAPVGSYFLRISFTDQNQIWCERSISSLDSTKYKSLKLYCRHNIAGSTWNVWISIGQDANNCKTFPLKAFGGGDIPGDHLTELEIPLDHPAWSTTGNPNMTAITWIEINPGCVSVGLISGNLDFDALHFYGSNIIKTAAAGTDFKHTREYVYKDEKIVDPDFAQEIADALINILKNKENRYRLPLIGMPFAQVGNKANIVSPTHGLNGDYYIVEAEHRVTPREGYITEITLEKPRLSLEDLLAEAIERKIKLIERGGIM